ncbi:MAG: DUF5615 family PIN-like protein [Flavobacteriales bacterium]
MIIYLQKICDDFSSDIEIHHVKEFDLETSNDISIWEFAIKYNYNIITKDDDFYDISLIKGYPPFVIWLNIGNCTTNEVINILKDNMNYIKDIINDEKAGLIEVIK